MTSPPTSPHFAPPSGADSPDDLAPHPLPLRGGAKSWGELGELQKTSPRPKTRTKSTQAYRCHTCGETFTAWAAAERHADTHHGARIDIVLAHEKMTG